MFLSLHFYSSVNLWLKALLVSAIFLPEGFSNSEVGS